MGNPTAAQIHKVLSNRYTHKGQTNTAYVREVSLGREYRSADGNRADCQGSIDAVIVHGPEGDTGPRLWAIEIKTTRANLIHELKRPAKRVGALDRCNQFYYVTPPGIADLDDIPADCGWAVVDVSAKRVYFAKVAPYTEALLDVSFVSALARKARYQKR